MNYMNNFEDSHLATEAEADREYVNHVSRMNPEKAWVLSPRDVWYPNPFYTGPKVPHPEDDPVDEEPLLNVTVSTWDVGPRHDPYSAKLVTVKTGILRSVSFYSDGLGSVAIKENRRNVKLGFANNSKEKKAFEDEFERLAGVSVDYAEDYYNRHYMEDPMGHPSKYE